MDLPKLIAQWTELHDACLAEAQTLIDVPGNEAVIHSLTTTALLCVDALLKLKGEPQLLNRSDLP